MTDYVTWLREKVGHDRVIMVACSGIIKNEAGDVLLVKRSDSEAQWSIPGGYLELGETPEKAVEREIFEETGLRVIAQSLQGVYTKEITYENGDVVWLLLLVYFCTSPTGNEELDDNEITELRYFAPDALPSNLRHPEIARKGF